MDKMSDQFRDEIVLNDRMFKEYVIDRFEEIKTVIPVCEKDVIKKELKIHMQLIILMLTVVVGMCIYIVQDTVISKLQAKEMEEAKRR